MTASSPLFILGGRSWVAAYLLAQLGAQARFGAVVSRRADVPLPTGFSALSLDLADPQGWEAPAGAVILSLVPLWVLAAGLPCLSKAGAVIALSSTSRFSKQDSTDPKEQALAARLTDAEDALQTWGRRHNVATTILRPTLIYDGVHDQNIAQMIRHIRRFGFLPVAAPAKGLRQPIHGDDVAAALIKAMETCGPDPKAYNIAGGEVLTYRAMASRVYAALGRKPRILPLPEPLLRYVFRLAHALGFFKKSGFGFHVFQRMNEDLIFDTSPGLKDLGLTPKGFELNL